MNTQPEKKLSRYKQVQLFLKTIFPSLENEYIELRCFAKGKPPIRVFCSSISELEECCVDVEQPVDYDVYIGVCPRSEKAGTKNAIKRVQCLWCDVDAKNFNGGKEIALKKIREFPISSSVIVDSGHGYHVYWLLKEVEVITQENDARRVEGCLKAIALALGGDTRACDLPRILRLPGTDNLKDPKRPLPVTLVECDAKQQCNLSDFESFLNVPTEQNQPVQAGNGSGWISEALEGLSDGNRNDTFCRIAGRLHHDGWLPADIISLLMPIARKVGFPKAELRHEIQSLCDRYPPQNSTTPQSLRNHGVVEELFKSSLEIVSLADVVPSDMSYVVQDIIPEGYTTFLYGNGGTGKSLLAVAIAVCVAVGKPFLGFSTKQCGVLYVDWELHQDRQSERFRGIVSGLCLEELPRNVFHVCPDRALNLRLRELQCFIEKNNIGLIIADSFAMGCSGNPESSEVAIEFLKSLQNLKRTVLIIDHQSKIQHGEDPKNKTIYGSTFKHATARSILHAVAESQKDDKLVLSLTQRKSSFTALVNPLKITVSIEKAWRNVRIEATEATPDSQTATQPNTAEQILSSLSNSGPATAQEISDLTGIPRGTVTNHVGALKRQNKICVIRKNKSSPVYEFIKA